MLTIEVGLLLLNVAEHVATLRQHDIVRKDLAVLLVEVNDARKTARALAMHVEALEELAHVVVDKVVLKYGHNMCVLVVDDVIHNLNVVVVS